METFRKEKKEDHIGLPFFLLKICIILENLKQKQDEPVYQGSEDWLHK